MTVEAHDFPARQVERGNAIFPGIFCRQSGEPLLERLQMRRRVERQRRLGQESQEPHEKTEAPHNDTPQNPRRRNDSR